MSYDRTVCERIFVCAHCKGDRCEKCVNGEPSDIMIAMWFPSSGAWSYSSAIKRDPQDKVVPLPWKDINHITVHTDRIHPYT